MSEREADHWHEFVEKYKESIDDIRHLLNSERIQYSQNLTKLEEELEEAREVMVYLMKFITPEQKQHGLSLPYKDKYYKQYQAYEDSRRDKKKGEIVSAQHAIRCQRERVKEITKLGGQPTEAFLEEEKQLKQNLADLEISDPMKTDLY